MCSKASEQTLSRDCFINCCYKCKEQWKYKYIYIHAGYDARHFAAMVWLQLSPLGEGSLQTKCHWIHSLFGSFNVSPLSNEFRILVAKLERVASNQRTKHTVRVQHGGKWNTRNSMHCSVRWGLITSNFAAKQKTFYNRPLMSFRLLFVVIFRWCTAQITAAHSLFSTLLHNEEAANLFLPLSRFCQAVI